MKKYLAVIAVAVMLALAGSPALAAGTCTQALESLPGSIQSYVRVLTFTCTADSAAATYPETAVSSAILDDITGWYIYYVETKPGTTQPTDNYDIVIEDAGGMDLMGGTLANRDTLNKERAFPKVDTANALYGGSYIVGATTLKITNNAVNSAQVTVKLYLAR
jgi:hypothetical protein